MIVLSLLLFLVGVGLLAAGLVIESIQLEFGAVASALLSALALYAGVRQRADVGEQSAEPDEAWEAPLTGPLRGPPVEDGPRADEALAADQAEGSPSQQEPVSRDRGTRSVQLVKSTETQRPAESESDSDSDSDSGPSDTPLLDDEPAEEEVSPANVARVAARSDSVLVVDGRPRYHRRACSALIGRETVPLPVSEAREVGFSPCARCRPDAHLLGSLERPQRR